MNQLMTNNYLPILTLGSVTSRGNEHKKHWVKQLASDHDISEGLEASHLDYPVELVIWFQAIGHVNDEVPEILHCRSTVAQDAGSKHSTKRQGNARW